MGSCRVGNATGFALDDSALAGLALPTLRLLGGETGFLNQIFVLGQRLYARNPVSGLSSF